MGEWLGLRALRLSEARDGFGMGVVVVLAIDEGDVGRGQIPKGLKFHVNEELVHGVVILMLAETRVHGEESGFCFHVLCVCMRTGTPVIFLRSLIPSEQHDIFAMHLGFMHVSVCSLHLNKHYRGKKMTC